MKKNKLLKILLVFLILMMIGLMVQNNVFAEWNFVQFDSDDVAPMTSATVTNVVGAIVNIVSIVSAGIAIIMLVVIGVKYVNAAPGGKAEVKKDLTGYIIGAVILFATTGILKLLQMFINANVNNIGSNSAGSGSASN